MKGSPSWLATITFPPTETEGLQIEFVIAAPTRSGAEVILKDRVLDELVTRGLKTTLMPASEVL